MSRIRLALALWLLLPVSQAAERWQFETRIAVTPAPRSGVFHHLEGAGRQHIAVSEQQIGLAWEDDRSGDPQVYTALKSLTDPEFRQRWQLSSGGEAYEPVIAALPGDRFIAAWEQDGYIHARALSTAGPGDAIKLGAAGAGHASLATFRQQVYLAWRERRSQGWFLEIAVLNIDASLRVEVESQGSIEPEALATPVLYPALAANAAGLSIAWEDRRFGHTRLLFSHSDDGAKTFSQPESLNEFYSNRNQYDQGNGVTRVAVSAFAEDEILAAWMDKRRGGSGYGIFASLGAEGGAYFGPNEKVHGDEGDRQPHYNPATAGNPGGLFAVAWDDYRRGESDIWISVYNDEDEWGEDFTPATASGDGEQTHPAIALDARGNLHLLWLERSDPNAPSQLWYSQGKALP